MILLLNRSFYPDTEASGQFLTDLAEALSHSFPVTAICGRSFRVDDGARGLITRDHLNGVRIVRVRHTRFRKHRFVGRLLNWFSYVGMAFWAAIRERPKCIFVQTDPPVLGALAIILKWLHRCPIVYGCNDVYPDVAIELGVVGRGLLSRMLDAANCRAYREAAVTVALGEDMAARIAAKGIPRHRIVTIPNWVDTSAIVPVPPPARFAIMYSGNIGLTQDFGVLAEALARLRSPRDRWSLVFAGAGAAREHVEKRLADLGLTAAFLPPQPREKLSELLGAGTLHVVPMKAGLAGCVVPSKIYGIMAAGRPYLAVSDSECDMARLAREEGCGLWAPAGDVEAVREQLDWAIGHPTDLEIMGRRGRGLVVERYDVREILGRWISLFRDVLRVRAASTVSLVTSRKECP